MKKKLTILIFSFFLLVSCGSNSEEKAGNNINKVENSSDKNEAPATESTNTGTIESISGSDNTGSSLESILDELPEVNGVVVQ